MSPETRYELKTALGYLGLVFGGIYLPILILGLLGVFR